MNAREANGRSSLVGSRIGKFDVIAEIGTGGMASVYLARQSTPGSTAGFSRLVAIKVMHPHLSQEDSFVEMFLDEARVAATIQHPNVVSIIDVGIEDGLIFLIMEYVEGDSFSNVEKMAVNLRRRIPLGIILRVVLDSLAGLHHAHELCDHTGTPLKIIHRDVSPQNVMVGVDGTARIVDFGIAKAESRITNTQVGLIKGKLNFMAPEQIRGQALDRRVDVFGMGVTLWEAITLRRLFAGDNEFDTARRILSGEYPSLLNYDASLPPVLDTLCQRALHPNPDERFSTAAEFADAIEHELRGQIAAAREVSAFIAGVATQKIERERRAVRESATNVTTVGDFEDDDEPSFMSTTVVEAPVRPPSPISAVQPVLPSTALPRDRSADELSTQKVGRFRAPTMSMPTRGNAGTQPQAARTQARGVVVLSGDDDEVGGTTRSLKVQPPRRPASIPPKAPVAGGHAEYDDDGATSPFNAIAGAQQIQAIRATPIVPVGAPTKPAPPVTADDEDDEDGFETGAARTVFQPRFGPGAAPIAPQGSATVPPPRAPTMQPAHEPTPRPVAQEPTPRPADVATAPSPAYAMPDRSAPHPMPMQPAPDRSAQFSMQGAMQGPMQGAPMHYGAMQGPMQGGGMQGPMQGAPVYGAAPGPVFPTPPEAPAKGGVPVVIYALASLLLVGGAAALLLYALRLRAG